MASEALQGADDTSLLYSQLDAYPWDTDLEFQGGLQAILGSVQDPQQAEHLTLRARCYYFARKAGTRIDFDDYKAHMAPVNLSQTSSNAEVGSEQGIGGGLANAPKPASFMEICEMIAEGKPIPGIREIPDTILEGQSSETKATSRKKPWEKKPEANSHPSWMTR
ncbi:hypothetical protein K431DRAFT_220528 [Polychaeton citri CBS 116435]|uniref:Uncharacterized protein n=1 Tax=Polychaeton citri CBS 116435 TaxID=1314669 RepID=A0A9P4QC22_9PEZI|nr:hypothetical protein K431DRAFT_220528 [Polychaeton citri CBS 116435]